MKKTTVLSNSEISSFCSQVSMLLKAGITVKDGMEILLKDTKNPDGKKIIQSILDSSRTGNSFTVSVRNTGLFPNYVENMIALGEESGKLDDVMESLGAYYEREDVISDNIRSAVTYPLVMIFLMLIIIFILITKVLPIFNQVFEQLGTYMDGLSGTLLMIGQSMQSFSVVFMSLLTALIIFYLIFTKTTKGKILFSHFCSNFILTRSLYDDVAAGRFASGFSLTLSSGMDTYQALDLLSQLVDHKIMQKNILSCKQLLLKGEGLSDALNSTHIFSSLYSRMVSIGVKTGSLDAVMKKIAQEYEAKADKKIQSVISIIEPTLVIILSLVVGVILLSVILPLMGIMSSIS